MNYDAIVTQALALLQQEQLPISLCLVPHPTSSPPPQPEPSGEHTSLPAPTLGVSHTPIKYGKSQELDTV